MNTIYPLAKQRLLEWALESGGPPGGATLNIVAVKDTYVFNAAHESLADIPGGAIVAPEREILNVTLDAGVVDGDDTGLGDMTLGQTIDAFIVYAKWPASTLLLCYMDTPTNATIPAVINSPAGLVAFAPEGIFQL